MSLLIFAKAVLPSGDISISEALEALLFSLQASGLEGKAAAMLELAAPLRSHPKAASWSS